MSIKDILQKYAEAPKQSFKFFGFISPPETEEHYQWAKECGYTHMQLFSAPHRGQEAENARIQKALELAKKNGLKIVWMGEDFVGQERPYADHPAFDGVYADEPLSLGDLEKLTKEMEEYQKIFPQKKFYVNFAQMAGRSWEIYSGYFRDHFLSKVTTRTVSGDTYPLREPNAQGKTMAPFLDYVRRIGEIAIETDSEMYFFVQALGMHGLNWIHPCRRPSWEDMRFLHYVILSCGAQGFQHFCYMSPGHPPFAGEFKEEDYSCIHMDGHRTEIWYSVQKVATEFKKFENIALKFHWKGIMPVYGEDAMDRCENFDGLGAYITNHSYIKNIHAQQDLLVGCFEDDDGNVGLTLVNFSDPYAKLTNNVSVCFDCSEPIAVIKDGEVTTVSLENGCYNTALQPGEGQYLILPKHKEAEIKTFAKEKPVPSYLKPPEKVIWKEDFSSPVGYKIDTFNPYGSGNSHFEYVDSGYPEGGNGRVVRLFTSTYQEKDWSCYKIKLPDIPYDPKKKIVFKMHFTTASFSVSISCDHLAQKKQYSVNTLERYGSWSWFEVPLDRIFEPDIPILSEVTMCIGAGIPYGTLAFLDEILLCE